MANLILANAIVPSLSAAPNPFARTAVKVLILAAVYANTETVVLLVAVLPLESVTVVEMVTVPDDASTPDVKLLPV